MRASAGPVAATSAVGLRGASRTRRPRCMSRAGLPPPLREGVARLLAAFLRPPSPVSSRRHSRPERRSSRYGAERLETWASSFLFPPKPAHLASAAPGPCWRLGQAPWFWSRSAFCSLARIFFAEPRGTHRPRRRDSCRIPSPASPDQAVLRTRTSRETQLAASGGRSDAVVAAAAETLGSPQPQETARRPARFRIW